MSISKRIWRAEDLNWVRPGNMANIAIRCCVPYLNQIDVIVRKCPNLHVSGFDPDLHTFFSPKKYSKYVWLVVSNMVFPIIYGMSSFPLTFMFFQDGWKHQPNVPLSPPREDLVRCHCQELERMFHETCAPRHEADFPDFLLLMKTLRPGDLLTTGRLRSVDGELNLGWKCRCVVGE